MHLKIGLATCNHLTVPRIVISRLIFQVDPQEVAAHDSLHGDGRRLLQLRCLADGRRGVFTRDT